MMQLFAHISIDDVVYCILVFLRCNALFFALPLFGDPITPLRVRTLLSIGVSTCVVSISPNTLQATTELSLVQLILLASGEIFIGLVIGYLARVLFAGLIMAASFVGYQMGFGTANLFSPDLGQQITAFTNLHRSLLMLLFLSMGLHFLFIGTLVESFSIIPVGAVNPNGSLGHTFIQTTSSMFITALKLASPILVALMFVMAALGLMARTVPQMNIFTLSFPVSFFIGLLVYVASVPLFSNWMSEYFNSASSTLKLTLAQLAP